VNIFQKILLDEEIEIAANCFATAEAMETAEHRTYSFIFHHILGF